MPSKTFDFGVVIKDKKNSGFEEYDIIEFIIDDVAVTKKQEVDDFLKIDKGFIDQMIFDQLYHHNMDSSVLDDDILRVYIDDLKAEWQDDNNVDKITYKGKNLDWLCDYINDDPFWIEQITESWSKKKLAKELLIIAKSLEKI